MVETARIRGGCCSLSTHCVLFSDGPKPGDVSAIKQLRLSLSLSLCNTYTETTIGSELVNFFSTVAFTHHPSNTAPVVRDEYSPGGEALTSCASTNDSSGSRSSQSVTPQRLKLIHCFFIYCRVIGRSSSSSSGSSSRKKVNQERTLDDSTLCKWLRPQWWLWGNNALDLMKKLLLFKLNKSIIVFVRSQSHETKCLFYMPPRS